MRESGKGDQKKKIRTDGGQVIDNKRNRKNLYPQTKCLHVFTVTVCYCCLLHSDNV